MAMRFVDYVDGRGENVIQAWLNQRTIPVRAKRQINARIRVLAALPRHHHVRPHMAPLADKRGQACEGLHEIRVESGGVAADDAVLHAAGRDEFIMLAGATERDRRLIPHEVRQQAFHRLADLESGKGSTRDHDDR
jgi:hypothetical protein